MKNLALMVFSLLFLNNLNAQEPIIIDWQELDRSLEESIILDPVRYGSFRTFRLENINRFLFEVKLEGKNIVIETPVPTELQKLFRLDSDELANTVTNEDVEETTEEINQAENKLKNLIDLKKLDYAYKKDEKNNLLYSLNIEKDVLTMVEEKEKILLQQEIKAIEQKEEALNEFEKNVNEYLLQVKDLSNEILKLRLTKIQLVILAQKDISASEMKILVNDIDEPKKVRLLHEDLSKNLTKLKKEYLGFLNDPGENEKKLLNDLLKKLNDSFNTLDEAALLSLYSEVNFLYTELQNENNFKVVAPPTQADADFLNYEVTISPSQTNTLGPIRNSMSFDFDVPVKGGLKVDFSVGPTFSFGKGAKDEKYFLQLNDTTNTAILRQRDNNNYINPGIAALMHFYRRSGTNTSFGGVFGVGAGFQTIEDINLSFYTGVSLVMGKQQKIMLNSGISFLNVERLKESEFEVGKEYSLTDFDLNNVTEKVFKPSFFLSITYNITNRVEK